MCIRDRWTPDEHFTRGIASAEKRIEPEFAKFVEAFLHAGFWWGGFFRRSSRIKPKGQSRGPAGMDTPHFEWRKAPPNQKPQTPTLPVLREGDTGEHVKTLIGKLRSAGFRLDAGQTFDARITASVMSLQSTHRIEVDGIVGPNTRRALNEAVKKRANETKAKREPIRLAEGGTVNATATQKVRVNQSGRVTSIQPASDMRKSVRAIDKRLNFLEDNVPRRLQSMRTEIDKLIEGTK